jgi:rubrerythrin
MAAARVPAGWYEHRSYPGRLRWWDGERWTSHLTDPVVGTESVCSFCGTSFRGAAEDCPQCHGKAFTEVVETMWRGQGGA